MPCHWDFARGLQTLVGRYHLDGVWPLPPFKSGAQRTRRLEMSGAFLPFGHLPSGLRQVLADSPPDS